MGEVIWLAVSVALFAVGISLVLRGTSKSWRMAGVAYAVGAVGLGIHSVFNVTGALDPPLDYPEVDIAVWFGLIGFFSIAAAMLLTLIALGQAGRRRFLIVFAATTLVVGTYQFWTSNWAARTGTAADRCYDTGHDSGPNSRIERMPPGVRCSHGATEVFVAPDAICWLALFGWTAFDSLLLTFPITGVAWAARRRPMLRPA